MDWKNSLTIKAPCFPQLSPRLSLWKEQILVLGRFCLKAKTWNPSSQLTILGSKVITEHGITPYSLQIFTLPGRESLWLVLRTPNTW